MFNNCLLMHTDVFIMLNKLINLTLNYDLGKLLYSNWNVQSTNYCLISNIKLFNLHDTKH